MLLWRVQKHTHKWNIRAISICKFQQMMWVILKKCIISVAPNIQCFMLIYFVWKDKSCTTRMKNARGISAQYFCVKPISVDLILCFIFSLFKFFRLYYCIDVTNTGIQALCCYTMTTLHGWVHWLHWPSPVLFVLIQSGESPRNTSAPSGVDMEAVQTVDD